MFTFLYQLAIKAGGSAEAGESAAGTESTAPSPASKYRMPTSLCPQVGGGAPGASNCLILSSL